MYTEIHVASRKCLIDTTIPLSPFTLLVGANGAGKTTALEELATHGGRILRAVPEEIAAYSQVRIGQSRDGYATGSVLAWYAEHQREAFARVVDGARRVMTTGEREAFTHVHFDRRESPNQIEGSDTKYEVRMEFTTPRDGNVPAYAIGAGVLVTLATLVAASECTFLDADDTKTLCIDGIENALHPMAQKALVAELRSYVAQGVQIVATTHSPDVADAFEAQDVVVLAGGKARRLSEHPEAEKWATMLRTGEFLGTVGEEWVVG